MLIETRWRLIAWPAGASQALIAHELEWLRLAYGEPTRHYHDIGHIAALLELSATHAAAIADRDAVDLAILYHDAVYDPRRSDNEAASAALARQRLGGLGFPAATIDKVARFILANRHEGAEPGAGGDGGDAADTDLDHLLDFDLSILAAEPTAYAGYAAAIRREYQMVPDAHYQEGRVRVLSSFLARPRIYRVAELAARWETKARDNMGREIVELRKVSDPWV